MWEKYFSENRFNKRIVAPQRYVISEVFRYVFPIFYQSDYLEAFFKYIYNKFYIPSQFVTVIFIIQSGDFSSCLLSSFYQFQFILCLFQIFSTYFQAYVSIYPNLLICFQLLEVIGANFGPFSVLSLQANSGTISCYFSKLENQENFNYIINIYTVISIKKQRFF